MNTFEVIKGSIDRAANGRLVGRLRPEFINPASVYSVCSVVLPTELFGTKSRYRPGDNWHNSGEADQNRQKRNHLGFTR